MSDVAERVLGLAGPGPGLLAVPGAAMDQGRRAGIALALAIAGGSVLCALMTAAGLSAVRASYAAALTVIKIVGGLYPLWRRTRHPRFVHSQAGPNNASKRRQTGGRRHGSH